MTAVDRPLRVVLVIGALGLGGTERQVRSLATALHRAGHDVQVVLLLDGGPHAEALRAAGVDVRGPLAPRGPARPLTAVVRLVRFLRATRPDVVHAFLLTACALAAPAVVVARVPVRVAGRRSLGDWKDGRPLVRAVERVTSPAYQVFVANAAAVAADVVRRERLDRARVHVIPNVVAPGDEEASAEADGVDEGLPRPLVLCVANLIAYKGHRHLLEAQELLRAEGLEFGLILVGEGPERGGLETVATAAGLPVRMLGARTDVPALLALADVFVLPSLHEGMSNALMEAMAAGLAVVATDVGGNEEVIGDAGVLCAPSDPRSLADALRTLLVDPARREELGRRAAVRVRERFGEERFVGGHVDLYRRLVEGSGANRPVRLWPFGRRSRKGLG